MKVTVKKDRRIQIEEVFNPVVLVSESGEEFSICMRDEGFELHYQGKAYSAKNGVVETLSSSVNREILDIGLDEANSTSAKIRAGFPVKDRFVSVENGG